VIYEWSLRAWTNWAGRGIRSIALCGLAPGARFNTNIENVIDKRYFQACPVRPQPTDRWTGMGHGILRRGSRRTLPLLAWALTLFAGITMSAACASTAARTSPAQSVPFRIVG